MIPLVVDLGREYRGGQHQALLLLQALRARGHAAELLTLHGSILARRAQSSGVRVHVVRKRWRLLSAALVIRRLLERGAEIVHANEPHALTAAWLARAHERVPLVASRRVIFPLSRGYIAQARYRAAARIIAVSQCVANAVVASGLARDRLTVISDGVPIPPQRSAPERETARRSLGIPPHIPLLGCVAALTPDKGQAILIRALTIIRTHYPECQLLLVGTGPCRSELGALSRELGLEAVVHFERAVEDIGRVFAAIDLFAFPAQAEALGTALLLAMAHGLPVVAAARGGIPEVVEEGRNGVLVNDLNPGALAEAIVGLLSNPAEAHRLGAAARETISARFSTDHMVDATLRLYEQLIAAYGRFE